MIVRIFLVAVALAFLAFGLWSFADPLAMTSGLGVEVGGPNGAYELRGIYGGVSLGAAALTGAGAILTDLRRPALWFLVTYMGGYIVARAGALALGPPPTADFAAFIAFEAAVLLTALASLRASAARA